MFNHTLFPDILLFLITAGSPLFVNSQSDLQQQEWGNLSDCRVCLTPACVEAAAEIQRNIDETVDPCEDFYKFACGNWQKRFEIPEGKLGISPMALLRNDLPRRIRALLNTKLSETEPCFIEMLQNMYESCMDLERIEELDNQPLVEVLNAIGGWPVIEGDKWLESEFDWIDTVISLRALGYNPDLLLPVAVEPVDGTSQTYRLVLNQTTLGINRDNLLNGLTDPITRSYFSVMVQAAKMLGAKEETVENELHKALNFEILLANISIPKAEKANSSRTYTVRSLRSYFPKVQWLKYFNGIQANQLHDDDTVVVQVPKFIGNISDIISYTEKRVIANYIAMRTVLKSMPYLSQKWRLIFPIYKSLTNSNFDVSPRRVECTSIILEEFYMALTFYYVSYYYKEERYDAAAEIVKYVQEMYLRLLENADWMDESVKILAMDKINNTKFYIGFPEELVNDTVISQIYEKLLLTRENYFGNILKTQKWKLDNKFSMLKNPKIKQQWTQAAKWTMIANAYYFPRDNTISIPSTLLERPIFHNDQPMYMNFGAIGFISGHEFGHALDSSGSNFDKDGNRFLWWDKLEDFAFQEKAMCIITQYDNYTMDDGMQVYGRLTMEENISDNAGLKAAYMAYNSWVENNGEELPLPSLQYSPKQLFWISAASVYCAKTKQNVPTYQLAGKHSPPQFRIIGTMSNLEEFASDFQCSLNTAMNKLPKCTIF